MKSDDELLDEIIAHLKSQPVPEVPAFPIASCTIKPRKSRSWVKYVAGAGALAASLVGILIWQSDALQMPESSSLGVVQQPHADTQPSSAVVWRVDLAEPLTQLLTNLDAIEAEIAELRSKAALLDARRKADELLAQK